MASHRITVPGDTAHVRIDARIVRVMVTASHDGILQGHSLGIDPYVPSLLVRFTEDSVVGVE